MKRSKFSLSHTRLLSCDMGELIPCGLVEVLPGDTIQHATSALIRASPLLAPVMHPVHVRIHNWFVPFRLIWSEFEDFITGGPAGTSLPAFPTQSVPGAGSVAVGSLLDYLGIPTGTYAVSTSFSALPLRAYNMIWNENYRDQDLETEAPISLASGGDGTTSQTLRRCAWEKDYFTSARPWEQKGPAITIPLGTSAPVVFSESGATPGVRTLRRTGPGVGDPIGTVQAGTSLAAITAVADLTSASAVTVGLLREALALQRFEEARARYGSRYVEYLRYLGVRSSDARLGRPEYLGGVNQTIQFSEVLQTAEGAQPVGDLRGHGIAGMRSRRYRRFFEEHGYVMSLMSVRPKTMYQQGLERHWNRRTKEDFFQTELQHIGQQEVLNKEVYAIGAVPDGIFGYQDRYDEYRRNWSSIHGEFRASTLNFWHFARTFGAAPALNSTFVSCVPTETPFAVPAEDVIYAMVRHNIQARRLVAGSAKSFIF